MSNTDASHAGPIGIGVTGHRLDRIGIERLGSVRGRLDMVMGAVTEACDMPTRLISSLADGTDALAADIAIARGWQLDAILPFARADYAMDHAENTRDAYECRLAAAHSVLELAAPRDAGSDAAAYERAGRLVLAQSDLLIAVWDGGPARGRGGAPQIIAEAVAADIPVVVIDPATEAAPIILWDGLTEHDLGQQNVDTVARGDLDALPAVLASAREDSKGQPPAARTVGRAFSYPLLLALFGVRRPRASDFRSRREGRSDETTMPLCSDGLDEFAARVAALVGPGFARADAEATATARAFRSRYVSNFALAALAVVLAMAGLIVPYAAKPLIVVGEFVTIATILVQTRGGNRAQLHTRWLDNRDCAERLRCLALGAQLGEMDLRAPAGTSSPWVMAHLRNMARQIGLPSVRADETYLGCVRQALRALLDEQIVYLRREAHAMHRLDHRLHLLGTCAFAMTAAICAAVFVVEWLHQLHMVEGHSLPPIAFLVATVLSAALPAIGAAIYGIRMQGDFAGIAERNGGLVDKLAALRTVDADDALAFDTLKARVSRATALLTEDRTHWRQIYHARPLTLPG